MDAAASKTDTTADAAAFAASARMSKDTKILLMLESVSDNDFSFNSLMLEVASAIFWLSKFSVKGTSINSLTSLFFLSFIIFLTSVVGKYTGKYP
ncbi:MAG: hypothetical protein J1F11_03440 [Oscillospiraceae bacterium]|nr:hypothetical protein [Oscillospiraceae bacterium]